MTREELNREARASQAASVREACFAGALATNYALRYQAATYLATRETSELRSIMRAALIAGEPEIADFYVSTIAPILAGREPETAQGW